MLFSEALYYPWIDISDEAWLKTSLLYWDSVRTIVPESIDEPYSTDTGRQLRKAGFLKPLRVRSDMEEVKNLTNDVIDFLQTNEAVELLGTDPANQAGWIHTEKLPPMFQQLATLHPEKLPEDIRIHLEQVAGSGKQGEWLHVDPRFADYYMTLLATRLSERVGAALLTPWPNADRLATSVRTDARLPAALPSELPGRDWSEYVAMSPRRNMPRALAPGLLAQLALERLSVDPATPLETILRFRDDHKDELARFRATVEELTAPINVELPAEALRQHVLDIYNQKVNPALNDMKQALDGRGIQWHGETLLKIAAISTGGNTIGTSALVALGMTAPIAILALAGASLVFWGIMYNMERETYLRNNPYSYLSSVSKKLGRL